MNCTKPILTLVSLILSLTWAGCDKSSGTADDNTSYNLSYGDSIIYLRPASGDYINKP